MAGKKQLPPVRLVNDDDAPDAETHLENLKAMHLVLKAHIHNENTLARDLSPLVRQARDISREIEELEGKAAALDAEVSASAEGPSGDGEFRLEAI